MTTTTQVTTAVMPDTPTPTEVVEQVPPNVSRETAVAAIIEETGCTRTEAFNMLQWLEGFVHRSRALGYVTQYPSDKQMSGRNYELFDAISPHGVAPEPGTAADLAGRAILDPSLGELSILHDQKHVPHAVYCTVQVNLIQVSLT